jgi:hypothetical protein
MEIFKNLGMRPIPSPTDYIMKGKSSDPGEIFAEHSKSGTQ